ncbi:MAG: hypothetical protein ACFFDH_24670 [Promethearchaeota archaeon]
MIQRIEYQEKLKILYPGIAPGSVSGSDSGNNILQRFQDYIFFRLCKNGFKRLRFCEILKIKFGSGMKD